MRRQRSRKTQLVINSAVAELDEPETEVDNTPRVVSNQLQEITFNLTPSKIGIRHELLGGVKYQVVPMVMITEGVHNGSNGPLYYPADELAKTPALWDHKPIVVNHPVSGGTSISACTPAVISARKVGIIFNTRWVAGKGGKAGQLKAEAWLETNRLGVVDERVASAVKNGKMMEVSTGLFTDNEYSEGLWKKEPYAAIARNYRADHLAILPDEKGSCSIADGAGLMRNSAISADDLRSQLQELVPAAKKDATGYSFPSSYLSDVFPTFFVYSTGKKMMKQNYVLTEGVASLSGAATPVIRTTTYKTPDGQIVNSVIGEPETFMTVNVDGVAMLQRYTTNAQGKLVLLGEPVEQNEQTGAAMNRKQAVNALISNADSIWDDDDRDYLMKVPNEQFQKLTANVTETRQSNGQPAIDSGGDDGDPDGELKDAKSKLQPKKAVSKTAKSSNAAKSGKPEDDDDEEDKTTTKKMAKNQAASMSAEDYIANAPPEIAGVLTNGLNQLNKTKQALIGAITANKANIFDAKFLATKSVDELECIAALAKGGATTNASPSMRIANYGGQGDVADGPTENAEDDEDPLEIPTCNFERKNRVAAEA